MQIKSKLPDLGTTIFAVMSKMSTDYKAINLSQGFPDFPISEELIELVHKAMLDGKNQYPPLQGVPLLLEAISIKIASLYGCSLNPWEEINITAGATQALNVTFNTLINEGDEVILFDPAYDSYDPVIRLNKATPVHIPLKRPDFSIDWEQVKAKVNDKTTAIVINSPHNPTGSVLTENDMRTLEELAEKNDLFVISDEVYEHIIFDDLVHESVLKYPKLRQRSVAVFSFGKTFHATGWKIGYMVAAPQIMKELRKVHQFDVFTVNTPMQYGLAAYLEDPEHYTTLPAFYQNKRDFFARLMESSRFTPIPTHGTYFQLFSYENISDKSDMAMAEWITKEHGVALIPTSAFYAQGEEVKLLRFCFAKKDDTLERAAERLCKI